MTRSYTRRTTRADADRAIRVRYVPREQIDAAKVAEVLIRLTLRHADHTSEAGQAGTYLRNLLTSGR